MERDGLVDGRAAGLDPPAISCVVRGYLGTVGRYLF